MANPHWNSDENKLIVADYFEMLDKDLAGRPYNKSDHHRRLRDRMGRSRSCNAIERKHQNISAVLRALGEAWIPGYTPMENFQGPLVDAVVRWLTAHPEWVEREPRWRRGAGPGQTGEIRLGPPPTLSNQPPSKDLEKTLKTARDHDVAGRDARNRKLGHDGEERAFEHERAVLSGAGCDRLAEQVCWVSKERGDGFGYDIESYELDGQKRLIEVKTTRGYERTPFHITRNEKDVADEHPAEWVLLRLWNFSREVRAFELRPPLERHVSLIAESYRAEFD